MGDAARGLPRLVDPIDDLVFGIALVKAKIEAQLPRHFPAIRFDIG